MICNKPVIIQVTLRYVMLSNYSEVANGNIEIERFPICQKLSEIVIYIISSFHHNHKKKAATIKDISLTNQLPSPHVAYSAMFNITRKNKFLDNNIIFIKNKFNHR